SLIPVLLLTVQTIVFAQDYPSTEIDLSKIADELYAVQDGDIDYEALYDNLMQILSDPINLNRATDEDFKFLHVLTSHQIQNLINYRKENGSLLSVYELQAVPDFDLQTIARLAPFVKVIDAATVIDPSLFTRITEESNNFLLLRIEPGLAARTNARAAGFEGSADKFSIRFRSSRAGDFSFGFCAEKDAGEPFRWNSKQRYYGFDYWAFHGQIQNKGRLKNLIVGDFQVQFGQGLMFGGIFGIGKGSETITTIRRSNIGLLPYTSVYETGFLRGVATAVKITSQSTLTAFYSRCLRDASTGQDSVDISVTSLQTSGLHRTENELLNRKQIADTNVGAVFQYQIKALEMGLTFNHYHFSEPFVPQPTLYNQFAFRGSDNDNVGCFVNYNWNHVSFFSEFAHSMKAGTAWLAGMLSSLTPSLDVSLLVRRYDRDFHTRYSNALSESSTPQNENGMYWGWKYRFNRRFNLSWYVDLFQFPWLRYRVYDPSTGHEWLARLTWQPSRKVMIYIQARQESKSRNVADELSPMYQTMEANKSNYWIHCEVGLREKLRLKSRAQFSEYEFNGHRSNGFLLAQDIIADAGRFQIACRYALFDTDDYDNRQYAYENDVLLAYSMPAFYGIGVRKMIMLRFKLNRYLSFWLRYSSTRSLQKEKIRTVAGVEDPGITNDLKFQLRVQF
ncbi:MAG TPA: helix-hairpin-helix domain-containing protein, partial [Chryseolinea sp.]|nr:helix-hairpin-helix domain-containing protein [Chryseolinea sp.]